MEEIVFQGNNSEHPLIVADQSPLRSLRFTGESRQSCINLQKPYILQLAYTRWMMAALLFSGPPRRTLLLGLGGGALVHFLLHHHPRLRIDVVEKSKAVISLAVNYFNLPDRANLRIHRRDAQSFCCRAEKRSAVYDLVLVDLFSADAMAPPMYRQDFYAGLCGLLTEQGVAAANLWGSNTKEFTLALKAMQRGSRLKPLQLKVPDKGNRICLWFRQPLDRKTLSRARSIIPAAEEQYTLPFGSYWKRLLLDNPFLMFRLLKP